MATYSSEYEYIKKIFYFFSIFVLLSLLLLILYLNNALAASLNQYIFISKWGNSFSGPADIAVDPSGKYVYVIDLGNNMIKKFDSNGFDKNATYVMAWGSFGSGTNQFRNPSGLAVDPSGKYVYVADTENDRIQKFDSNGNFVTKWGATCHIHDGSGCIDPDGTAGPLSLGDGQFYFPSGISIDSSGNVYVADTYNDRIQKFDSSGNFVTKWGTAGNDDGKLQLPADIAVDPSGKYVYVADTYNDRIQKFDSSGNFVTKWGTAGNDDGQFNQPLNISIDPSGKYVYVADTENDRIQKFDSNGNFVTKWGTTCYLKFSSGCIDPDGTAGPLSLGDGQFAGTSGVAFDPSGTFVYVIDSGNNRVQVFSLPPNIEIRSLHYDHNPSDPFAEGPRWGIDKVQLVGNSTYSASSYGVIIDWGDGITSGSPITSSSGLWGYNNKVQHVYDPSATAHNPQRIVAKLVNSDGVIKATTEMKPLYVKVLSHNVYLLIPINNYVVPWNGTTIFPLTVYDFEDGKLIDGKRIHFNGTGAIGVVDKLTDDQGRVLGRGRAPGAVGNWSTTMYFDGGSEYKSTRVPMIYNTESHEGLLQFSVLPTQVSPGGTYDVYGVLVDASTGQKLGSKQIHLRNGTSEIGSVATDVNGLFHLGNLKAPINPGPVYLRTIFKGSYLYHGTISDIQILQVR